MISILRKYNKEIESGITPNINLTPKTALLPLRKFLTTDVIGLLGIFLYVLINKRSIRFSFQRIYDLNTFQKYPNLI